MEVMWNKKGVPVCRAGINPNVVRLAYLYRNIVFFSFSVTSIMNNSLCIRSILA